MMLLMVLAQAAAQVPPSTSSSTEPTVVVVGTRLKSAADALAACIARKCPPNEEIVASLRKADAEFMAGEYDQGRKSMGRARARNLRYAKQYPTLVAEISRVDSRLAGLVGRRSEQRLAAAQALDALRAGLPATDPRILTQRLELGDAYAVTGSRFDEARTIYNQVAKEAKRQGHTEIYGRALLRPAVMYSALLANGSLYRTTALASFDAIDRTTEPELEPVRQMASVLRVKVALKGGTPAEVDAAIAAASRFAAAVPVTLVAPPVTLGRSSISGGSLYDLQIAGKEAQLIGTVDNRPQFDIEDQWVDVGFRIAPDGSVRDVEVLRQGRKNVDSWIPDVKAALAARRYVPLPAGGSDLGMLRIERYSMVSDLTDRPASRIRGRLASPHVQVTDLTQSNLAKAVGRP